MNIQSTINQFLDNETMPTRIITVIGSSGSASIPDNCHVTMSKCEIGTLSAGLNCSVILAECEISGSITLGSGSLTMDRCTSTGDLQISSAKVTQKLCTFDGDFTLDEAGTLDSYNNTRNGKTKVTDGTGTFRKDVFPGGDGVEAVRSAVTLFNCNINSDSICLKAVTSTVEASGCDFTSTGAYAIHANESKLTIRNVVNDIVGKSSVHAENGSQIFFYNIGNIFAEEWPIVANGGSTVEVRGFGIIQSETEDGIKLSDGSTVRCVSGSKIESLTYAAVACNSSNFYADTVHDIMCPDCAIHAPGNSVVEVVNIAGEIFGYVKEEVVPRNPRNGIAINGTLRAFNVGSIKGGEANGIKAWPGSSISVQNVGIIKGEGVSGIKLENGCTAVVSGSNEIYGFEYGIELFANCSANISDVTLITSIHTAIGAASNADVTVVNCDQIIGEENGAIEITSGKVIVRDCREVIGLLGSGVGVGASGDVYVTGCTTVQGEEGDGIHCGGGIMRVENCSNVLGGGGAVVAVNGCHATVFGCNNVHGGEQGLKVKSGSRVDVSACTVNGAESALVDSSALTASGCNFIGDLDLESASFSGQDVSIDGDLNITNSSAFCNSCTATGGEINTGTAIISGSSDMGLIPILGSQIVVTGIGNIKFESTGKIGIYSPIIDATFPTP